MRMPTDRGLTVRPSAARRLPISDMLAAACRHTTAAWTHASCAACGRRIGVCHTCGVRVCGCKEDER